ncbi:MAG: BatA domain-containing protein [Lentisphaerales bacterium]|nr:BatA domain-containing protein [Lentisphaerales bacterium]
MNFAAPLLLGGLAAIAIPIILHLMARDVPQTIRFSTLRFLTKDKLETHSKKGIRDLLLLIMRCLIIAGLVLAFSKPFIPFEEASVSTEHEVVVLLDNSASMNRPDIKTLLETKLSKVIKDNSQVAFIVSGNGQEAKVDFQSKGGFLKSLGEVKPGLHEGHHEEALNEALLSFHKEAASKTLIIASDFQVQDWQMKQLPKVPEGVEVQFVKVFDKSVQNVSIFVDRIRKLNAGKVVQVQVYVSNNSSLQQEEVIKFTAGQKVVEQKVSLNAGEAKKLVLTMQNPDASKALVSLSGKDEFIYDNEFHLWLGDEAPVTVAFPESAETNSLDFIFVKKALQDVKAGDASFRVTSVESQLFSGVVLQDYQALVLTDTAHDLQVDVYEEMSKYVEEGGLVIAAPATRAGMIFSRLKAYGLADVRFKETVRRKKSTDLPFRFEELSESSSLLDIFDETPDSDLQQFPIYSYNHFTIGGSGQSILEIKKGIPAVVVFPKGKGNVIVSAIPFNHIWSDFTISNSFLPLLRHMIVSKAATEENSVLKLSVGERRLKSGSFDEYIDTAKVGSFVVDETPVTVNISKQESIQASLNLIDFKARLFQENGKKITMKEQVKEGFEYWHYFFALAVIALLVEFILADLKPVAKATQ